ANRVWGATAGNSGRGSRVALRLGPGSPPLSNTPERLLPHADPKRDRRKAESVRAALPVGTKATLILQRLPGCVESDWEDAQRATKAWLLLGTLGYRGNRAAGSVWPDADWAPRDETSFSTLLRE